VAAAIAAAVLAAGPGGRCQEPSGLDLSRDKTMYGISTMHLDTQWLWTIQDTIREYLPHTLRGQFALMEQFPHYTFSFEGAFRYMLMKEYYPDDYRRLKQYVADGRWRVAGSSVVAGDTNIPSPESLIRQVLYGNGFFRKEFGKTSLDVFLPDCFGFGYALPSVAAHCGLKGFSTQKLSWGSAVDIPFDIGTWEGPDGSSIVAALKPGSYMTQPDRDYSTDPESLARIEAFGDRYGVYAAYRYFGGGDQGGALGPGQARWLEKSAADTQGPIRFLSTGSDQLYRDLTPDQVAKLPHYNGELVMTTHGVGCYTSQAVMKRWNRRNELLADAAERAAVAADWLGGVAYPRQRLRDNWVRFLWHQFHDDVTGTSIPQAYTFSWNDELLCQNQFAQVLANSAGAVARALDTRARGVPIVVYNPVSIARQDIVSARVRFAGAAPEAVRVFGPDGAEVPSQVGDQEANVLEVIFLATVPSVGFAVYDVRPAATPCELRTGLSVSESRLQSDRYLVELDGDGDVARIFDKSAGRELLSGPARFELRRDNPDGFFSWEIPYRDVTAEPKGYVEGPIQATVVERGPARVALEVTRRAAGSTFVQRIRLAAGDAGNRVEFDTAIDWKTRSTLVKARFPLAVANPVATYDLGLGTIERGNDTERKYEVPAQQWADITAPDGSYGVTVLNDCKYGWDKPADDTLRLSIVRNPAAGHYEGINDVGSHRLLYAICGHPGDWREAGVPWEGARLNQPLLAFQPPRHGGTLGRSFSMVKVNSSQVAVKALKKAEDSDEVVIRLQELTGRPADRVELSFMSPVSEAREIRGDEQPLGPATVVGGKLVTTMSPYQPRTFALRFAPPRNRLTPPRCRSVGLPYTADVVSGDGEPTTVGIDGQSHAIPRELWPRTVDDGGIVFTLGPAGAGRRNAVVCRGQRIALNARPGDRLYLLAAAVAGDHDGVFFVGGRAVKIGIAEYTGFIGQWNSRVVDGQVVSEIDVTRVRPGFVKRQPVAWIGTHRHNREGGNDPYVFCYLFKHAIDLPQGADFITLPRNDRILIFAATIAPNPNDDTVPAQTLAEEPPGAQGSAP
jgi:alpha-mannosidase